MAIFEADGVRIRYETYGEGPAVLLLAPGGLRNSRIETWASGPIDPIPLLSDTHLVVAMDQRNTGTSWAPITADDGWQSYAADQLALMDHLGIERFAIAGQCIGGAFVLRLLLEAPERITAAVALQPIGRDDNRDSFRTIFAEWRATHAGEHPEAGDADFDGLWSHLFGGDDLLWSVPDAALASISTPLLVLRGNDHHHPAAASEHLAATVPGATLIERWRDPDVAPAAAAEVAAFLAA